MQWVDQQPFDLNDAAAVVLKGHVARTELNTEFLMEKETGAHIQSRSGVGPSVPAGPLNSLLGLGAPSSAWSADAYGYASHGADDRAWKRPRTEGTEGDRDTLCIKNLGEKSQTEDSLTSLFEGYGGFVTLRVATHQLSGIENCFVKFSSEYEAQAALDVAPAWLEAQIARKSLNVSAGTPGEQSTSRPASTGFQSWPSASKSKGSKKGGGGMLGPGAPKGSWDGGSWGTKGWDAGGWDAGGWDSGGAKGSWSKGAKDQTKGKAKDPNGDEYPGDTVVIMNFAEKGYSEDSVMEYWPSLPGFVALRIAAPTGKGQGAHCFLKYSTPKVAQQALDGALAQGWDATIARNSLNSSQATLRASDYP